MDLIEFDGTLGKMLASLNIEKIKKAAISRPPNSFDRSKRMSIKTIMQSLKGIEIDYNNLYNNLKDLQNLAEIKAKELYVLSEEATKEIESNQDEYAEKISRLDDINIKLDIVNCSIKTLESSTKELRELIEEIKAKIIKYRKDIENLKGVHKEYFFSFPFWREIKKNKDREKKHERNIKDCETSIKAKQSELNDLIIKLEKYKIEYLKHQKDMCDLEEQTKNTDNEVVKNKLLSVQWSNRATYCAILANKIELFAELEKTLEEFKEMIREFLPKFGLLEM